MLFRLICLGPGAIVALHADTAAAISRQKSRAIYDRELVSRSGCLYDYSDKPCDTCLEGAGCNEVGPSTAVNAGGDLGW